jgi:hypothetical protein
VSEPDDVAADDAADAATPGAADGPAEAADRAAERSERADAIPLQRPAPQEEEIHLDVAAAPAADPFETQPDIAPEQPAKSQQPAETEQAAATEQAPDTEQAQVTEQAPGTERALSALADIGSRIGDLAEAAAELSRLRSRDTDLIARLHEDNTKLRNGEIASALNPVVIGMIKLHDQMVSLGALSDPASAVGMLHTQLLQIMELTCAVQPFSPVPGEPFDASRHTGTRRIPTTEASADGTVAGTSRAGFARADGSVVRVAEVEVHRLTG